MPLLFSGEFNGAKFGVWHISESVAELESLVSDARVLEKSSVYHTDERRSQFLASRLLAQRLLGECYEYIENNAEGKPYLPSGKVNVSISHTHDYVAFAFSDSEVGIDIENSEGKAYRVRSKFLSEKELQHLCCADQKRDAMLRWSLKETIYKIYGHQCYDFKNMIEILPYELSREGTVDVRVKGVEMANAYYMMSEDFVLTICTGGAKQK